MVFLYGSKSVWAGSSMGKSADSGSAMVTDVWLDVLLMMIPIWASVLLGLVLGWSWKPRWVSLAVMALRSRPRLAWSFPPGFGARRLWLAATAAAVAPALRETWSRLMTWSRMVAEQYQQVQHAIADFPKSSRWREQRRQEMERRVALELQRAGNLGPLQPMQLTKRSEPKQLASDSKATLNGSSVAATRRNNRSAEAGGLGREGRRRNFRKPQSVHFSFGVDESSASGSSDDGCGDGEQSPGSSPASPSSSPTTSPSVSPSAPLSRLVTENDLLDLVQLTEEADGGPQWALLMDKKAPGMLYTAWRRDLEDGPTQYRSRSLLSELPGKGQQHGLTAELVRDFFWDDDFRPAWDGLLSQWRSIEECGRTGTQVVQWTRKFPLFCKDREYVIARRIFSHGSTFYCISKGIDHPAVQRKDAPRRVDIFFSSWRIREVTPGTVEVLLFHHEEMGIQRDVAKLGVRQAMWGCVRKMRPGVEEYARRRAVGGGKPLRGGGGGAEKGGRWISRSMSMASLHTPVELEEEERREREEAGGKRYRVVMPPRHGFGGRAGSYESLLQAPAVAAAAAEGGAFGEVRGRERGDAGRLSAGEGGDGKQGASAASQDEVEEPAIAGGAEQQQQLRKLSRHWVSFSDFGAMGRMLRGGWGSSASLWGGDGGEELSGVAEEEENEEAEEQGEEERALVPSDGAPGPCICRCLHSSSGASQLAAVNSGSRRGMRLSLSPGTGLDGAGQQQLPQPERRKGRRCGIGWVVAGSALAVLCGLDKGIVVKVLAVRVVQRLLQAGGGSGGRRRRVKEGEEQQGGPVEEGSEGVDGEEAQTSTLPFPRHHDLRGPVP